MVNIFAVYKHILHGLMKMVGMRTQIVEIEPGIILNFWVPKKITKTQKSKPALVFIHGFAMDGITAWQLQVLPLAKDYAVYVPDLLFFGSSTTDKPERSPEFQAECVAKGLMKLGLERCTLVGFSYGGIIAFKMGKLYPNLVEAMMVSGSVMSLCRSISNASLQRLEFESWPDYLLPNSAKGVRNMFELAVYWFPYVPDWIYKHYFEVMFDHRKEREELLEALVMEGEDYNIIGAYIQMVHLLMGENDKIFDMETATNLKKQLGGNASLEFMERTGHLVQLERPFVYNSNLKKFLSSMLQDVNQD